MGRNMRIEGSSSEVSIRSYKHGLVLNQRTYSRKDVSAVRSTVAGSSGNTQMKRVELIVAGKPVKLASWMDEEKADEMVNALRGSLGV